MMLKRNLAKVSNGLRKAVSEGEWTRLFGTAPGANHHVSYNEFCQNVQLIKELMAENDQAISSDSTVVLNGLLSAVLAHVTPETVSSTGHPGPFLEKLIEETLLELLVRWSCRLSSVMELWRVQLRFYLVLLSESSQPVLQQMSIVRPLKRVLQECARSRKSIAASPADDSGGVDEAFVQLLLQLCVIMNREKSALEQFLAVGNSSLGSTKAGAQSQCAEFAIFSYLVPYMHHCGVVGTQARDGLVLCLLQAANNSRALSYIKNDSNFCSMLGLGLGGLYSELPTQLKFSCADWGDLTPMIPLVPGLQTFVQSLQFCNDVIQIALPGISSQLASLIRTGFFEQILAHMLLQPITKDTISAVAYLNVILLSITEPVLLCELLKFILQYMDDEGNRLLHRLIAFINSRDSQLSNVALSLFISLLDLNCEDVMLELTFKYLLPGDHVQPSQWSLISQPDLCSESATRFLVLIPSCCWHGEQLYMEVAQKSFAEKLAALRNVVTPSQSPLGSVLQSGEKMESPSPGSLTGISVVDGYRELLTGAHECVLACEQACRCWSSRYNSCHASYRLADAVPFSGWSSLATTSVAQSPVNGRNPTTAGVGRSGDDHASSSGATSNHSSDSGLGRGRTQTGSGSTLRPRSDSTDSCSSHASASFPTSGLFLAAVLDRLGSLLTQDSYSTLLVTSLLSRLARYPQPLLTSYILNHSLMLKAEVPSLHRTLTNLKDLIDSLNKRYDDFPHYLARARKTLLARQIPAGTPHAANTVTEASTPGRLTESPFPNASTAAAGLNLHTDLASGELGRSPRTTSGLTSSAVAMDRSNVHSSKPSGKKKRPAAQMLFSIVILHEFLKEMAAIAQEQSLLHYVMIE
eukprot:scpid36409/ scgid4766/ Protein FAM160A1